MAEALEVIGPRAGSSPLTLTVTDIGTFDMQSAFAHFDGTSASGPFRPAVTVRSQNGTIVARCFPSESVAAGDTADVTYGPFLDTGGASGSLVVEDGTTTVNPATTLDFTSGATVTDGGGGVAQVAVTGAAGLVPLKTITLGSPGALVWGRGTNGTIPQTYMDLVCVGKLRVNTAVVASAFNLTINADVGSTYAYNYYLNNGGGVSLHYAGYPTAAPLQIGSVPGTSAGSNYWGAFRMEFFGYADPNWVIKEMYFHTATLANNETWVDGQCSWVSTTPFNIDYLNFGTFDTGSRLDFYGRGTL